MTAKKSEKIVTPPPEKPLKISDIPSKGKGPRVSVLVPVYNVEKYLLECLRSLSNQILDDMEIIALNDGSTDSSLDILKDFRKKEPRLKIVDKKNTGYGDTMNAGLRLASGEYIGIVEPDDFVDPEMFIELYALAKKFDADVVRSNYFEYRNGENTVHEAILPEDAGFIIDPTDDPRVLYQSPAIWAGLYRREFLLEQKIKFLKTPGASYQDASFNFKTLAAGGRIVLTDKPYLHYRRDNEKSSVKSAEKVFCVNDEYAEIERFLKEKGSWDTYCFVFQAVKFAAYHWNLLRLDGESLEKSLLRLRAEFHDADARGLLKKRYFPKNHWRALRTILNFPPQVFLTVFKAYRGKKKQNL